MGDKLQQKMDSVAFSQERMKRQLDDLQDRTQVDFHLKFFLRQHFQSFSCLGSPNGDI